MQAQRFETSSEVRARHHNEASELGFLTTGSTDAPTKPADEVLKNVTVLARGCAARDDLLLGYARCVTGAWTGAPSSLWFTPLW
jgi:hypothetical protein